jgi:hypothetical protein
LTATVTANKSSSRAAILAVVIVDVDLIVDPGR